MTIHQHPNKILDHRAVVARRQKDDIPNTRQSNFSKALDFMLPSDFARLRNSPDKEALCHAVFDETHTKWTFAGLTALNREQITVMCVETFFGEVLNGGFEQYLTNESGRLASQGPAALQRVGLGGFADILEQVLARCTNTPAVNDHGIQEDFFEVPEHDNVDDTAHPLQDLDDRFFEFYFANKLEFREKLFEYIVANEAAFVAVP